MSLVFACLAQLAVAVSDRAQGPLDSYRVFWPEHWAFFTGLAGKDVLMAYRLAGDGTPLTPFTQREAWTDRLMGLDRIGDSQALETWQLANRIPDRFWADCGAPAPDRCVTKYSAEHPFRLSGQPRAAPLCGVLAIADTRPVPAVGDRMPAAPRRIYKIAIIDVECAK
ncbi:hypothetical protein [Kutzneria sp. 744]|uniref:hypothetical protein n=1 Tax=Kutzneria sp. (strain 744) TaxID=345341 RepID=UPI0018DB6843|nr:hypothetical protein [Kutzneria sp. 744]